MNYDIIEGYIERVYGYAVKRTFTREEADELAQEILYTAVRELPKLKDESKFEPWLWGVAGNVTRSFRRSMGRQRAMYSYDMPELPCEDRYPDDRDEEYDFLRTKIAMLSAIYRDIIVLYYYDGLSTKRISEKLNVPEGTVRWRLAEARRKLKKGYDDMNETALKPVRMKLGIYGTGNYNGVTVPFPDAYINDALSQNILYYCSEQPCGVEELAGLCGVPAYYIEDRIDNLLKRQAVTETSKGRYLTDFVIWTDKYGIYCEENAEKALLPIMDRLLDAFDGIAGEAARIDFYKAGKSENDLYYLYGKMAFSYACERYCRLPYPRFKKKYDGGEWGYQGYMETGAHRRITVGRGHNSNFGGRLTHTVYSGCGGLSYRQMMFDNYINVCEDILRGGSTEDADSAANAIRCGYIVRKEDGSLYVTVPFFNKEQKAEFDAIADKYLAPLMPEYSDRVDGFISGYKKLFPKHLTDDADRLCRYMFESMYTVIVEYAQRTGKVALPSPGYICDVLIEKG